MRIITRYADRVCLKIFFQDKKKLDTIPYGNKRFNWRSKTWDYYPSGKMNIDEIVGLLKAAFPDAAVELGIESYQEKSIITLEDNHIYLSCPSSMDIIARDIIASSSWDKKKNLWKYDLSMDNLWILSKAIEGVALSEDSTTLVVYRGLVARKKSRENLTKKLTEIKTKSEICENYNFPVPPFEHQKVIFNFLINTTEAALLADCGCGKTFCTINAINYNLRTQRCKSALVICPLSVMYNAWASDIDKFGTGNSYSVLWTPTSGRKRLEYIKDELNLNKDIYIINFDGAKNYKNILKKHNFDYVIIDESSKIKNEKSSIFKACVEISENSKYRTIMSATPAPNDPMEMWSQFYFLDRGETLGSNPKDFRQKYYDKLSLKNKQMFHAFTKFTLKPKAIEMLHRKIDERSFRIKAEDCQDLPDKLFKTISTPLSKKQRKHYEEIKEYLFTELEAGDIVEASNEMVSLAKLRQVTSGFLFVEGDEPLEWLIPVDRNPKITACDDLVNEIMASGRKVMIWAQFREEIKMLTKRYECFNAVDYYGGTKAKNKISNIERFQKDPECRIIVAHPQSLGHGVTLVQANYAIYFSLDFSQENYYQSTKRIHRPGQKEKCFYYHLIAPDTVDEIIMKAIKKKSRQQTALVDG